MKTRRWIIIILTSLCLVVLVQNMEVVSFRVLFWKVSVSRIIAFPLLILSGTAIGFVLGRYARAGSRR